MRNGSYIVTVLDNDTNRLIDTHTVPFGEWKEIGYWLDDCGYNDSRYYVSIRFKEGE